MASRSVSNSSLRTLIVSRSNRAFGAKNCQLGCSLSILNRSAGELLFQLTRSKFWRQKRTQLIHLSPCAAPDVHVHSNVHERAFWRQNVNCPHDRTRTRSLHRLAMQTERVWCRFWRQKVWQYFKAVCVELFQFETYKYSANGAAYGHEDLAPNRVPRFTNSSRTLRRTLRNIASLYVVLCFVCFLSVNKMNSNVNGRRIWRRNFSVLQQRRIDADDDAILAPNAVVACLCFGAKRLTNLS